MAKFERESFRQDAMYVYYEGRFVARFKYKKSAIGSFIAFIRKNFTVEEYFGRLDAGEGPLTIAESKGYVLPHIRKWLRDRGYPETQEGFAQWRKDSYK